eukprot:TRINITY_DN21962_c0_g1_i1.p1 TRINITY_DN21962_c0_g1~~TRINITY_DN21962_c0_g1_i1.p1  ORF type:complete len:218 (+),score=37.63 TRINITY_DN21962_c0_g1_i1:46-699(+)
MEWASRAAGPALVALGTGLGMQVHLWSVTEKQMPVLARKSIERVFEASGEQVGCAHCFEVSVVTESADKLDGRPKALDDVVAEFARGFLNSRVRWLRWDPSVPPSAVVDAWTNAHGNACLAVQQEDSRFLFEAARRTGKAELTLLECRPLSAAAPGTVSRLRTRCAMKSAAAALERSWKREEQQQRSDHYDRHAAQREAVDAHRAKIVWANQDVMKR